MVCRRVRRVVFLWVDQGERLRDPVARHLDECPQCRDRAAEIERLIAQVRSQCPRATAPSGLSERIRFRLGLE